MVEMGSVKRVKRMVCDSPECARVTSSTTWSGQNKEIERSRTRQLANHLISFPVLHGGAEMRERVDKANGQTISEQKNQKE